MSSTPSGSPMASLLPAIPAGVCERKDSQDTIPIGAQFDESLSDLKQESASEDKVVVGEIDDEQWTKGKNRRRKKGQAPLSFLKLSHFPLHQL